MGVVVRHRFLVHGHVFKRSPWTLVTLLFANILPLYAVLAWGWKSFDLIFLYWLENVMIGVFCLWRFIVRPYSHKIEAAVLLFIVPFFIIHYGGFCWGHGTFVIHLLGRDLPESIRNLGIPGAVWPLLQERALLWPVLAMFLYQCMDWWRDTLEYGVGSLNLKQLMVDPYKRIVVLHIAIIGSGFALQALDEPLLGLCILVLVKTVYDISAWYKGDNVRQGLQAVTIDAKAKQKIEELVRKPTVKINGKEINYENYDAFKASKHYNLMKALLNMTVGSKRVREFEDYAEKKNRELKDL